MGKIQAFFSSLTYKSFSFEEMKLQLWSYAYLSTLKPFSGLSEKFYSSSFYFNKSL